MDTTPADNPDPAIMAQLLGQASSWCLQGEVNIQTRLANYLLAYSFFTVSWATVDSATPHTAKRTAVLAVLAMVSAVLSAT
jgi:hypothetical protein